MKLHCPQCQSTDVVYYSGLLGYEAVRCNTCNEETDLFDAGNHSQRTDRATVQYMKTMSFDEAKAISRVTGFWVLVHNINGKYSAGPECPFGWRIITE